MHVTNNSSTLVFKTLYNGKNKIFVKDGKALSISHIEKSLLHSDNNSLVLKDALVVPL